MDARALLSIRRLLILPVLASMSLSTVGAAQGRSDRVLTIVAERGATVVVRGTGDRVTVASGGRTAAEHGVGRLVVSGAPSFETVVVSGTNLPSLKIGPGVERVRFAGRATFAGDVVVVADSPLCICADVSSSGDISFTAGNSSAAGDNLTVAADVTSTGGGTIALGAGDDIVHDSGLIKTTGGPSNLVRLTADLEGSGVADGDRGGIAQNGGSVVADNAALRAHEGISYQASGNDVANLAATVASGFLGHTLDYTDATGFNVATVDGLSGVSTGCCGVTGRLATIASSGNGDISITAPLEGKTPLAVHTGGVTRFDATVGATTALESLSTDGAGSTVLAGGIVRVAGHVGFNDPVTLASTTTVTSLGGGAGLVFFNSTVDGAFDLTANTPKSTQFFGNVGGLTPLASLTTDTGGTTTINANVTTSGEQRYNDTARVTGNGVLTAQHVRAGAGFEGSGTVSAPLSILAEGTLSPGLSPGCFATADLALAGLSTYTVGVGGTTPCSQYDQVAVTGTVTLVSRGSATLNVSLESGFTPTVGQQFPIITNDGNDAVTGVFAGLEEGSSFLVGGTRFTISYVGGDGNDVVLTVVAPTAVVVASFGARAGRDGVKVSWRTHSEVGLSAFQVWRGRRLLAALPARGDGVGGSAYRFVDRTARAAGAYVYRLRLVRADGSHRWAGRIVVRRGARSRSG